MKLILIFFCLQFSFVNNSFGQQKTPYLLRMQDKSARKNVKRHVKFDTLIKTSKATLHISFSNDLNKPTLLLMHGMGANARTNWTKQIKTLSKKFNLILPDLIYFGESISDSENYSVEFQVEQIHEAVVKLGFTKKINVIGFSYGGLVAAVYNELFQNSVQKLIIADGPVKYFSTHLADSIAENLGIVGLQNMISPSTIKGFNAMQTAAVSKKIPLTKRIKLKIIKYVFMPSKSIRDKQMKYLTENEKHYCTLNYNLDKTNTLLIWGGKDGVIPISVGISLNREFPLTTKLIVFPKAKHDVHFRNTKKFNKEIIHFLEN